MKRILMMVACCLMLAGCGENKADSPKEYTFKEIRDAHDWFEDEFSNIHNDLTTLEIDGPSDNEDEQFQHRLQVYNEYADKIMQDSPIPQNQKVVVSGYIKGANEVKNHFKFSGSVYFQLKPNDGESIIFDNLLCKSDDISFLELENDTPIKIEGIYMKQGCVSGDLNFIFDCKIVE